MEYHPNASLDRVARVALSLEVLRAAGSQVVL